MTKELDHNGNPLLIGYTQLKEFLPNYADWFQEIEQYSLTYEVIYYFNYLYREQFGVDDNLTGDKIWPCVQLLQEAMMEWDL